MWRQKSFGHSSGLVGHLAYIFSITTIVVVALVCLVAIGRGHYGNKGAGHGSPASFRTVLTGFSGELWLSPGDFKDVLLGRSSGLQ